MLAAAVIFFAVSMIDPNFRLIVVQADNPAAIELGGDWSTYWYDGRIYESDITRGLLIWDLHDTAVAGAQKLGHLNPQTQEFTIG